LAPGAAAMVEDGGMVRKSTMWLVVYGPPKWQAGGACRPSGARGTVAWSPPPRDKSMAGEPNVSVVGFHVMVRV